MTNFGIIKKHANGLLNIGNIAMKMASSIIYPSRCLLQNLRHRFSIQTLSSHNIPIRSIATPWNRIQMTKLSTSSCKSANIPLPFALKFIALLLPLIAGHRSGEFEMQDPKSADEV